MGFSVSLYSFDQPLKIQVFPSHYYIFLETGLLLWQVFVNLFLDSNNTFLLMNTKVDFTLTGDQQDSVVDAVA